MTLKICFLELSYIESRFSLAVRFLTFVRIMFFSPRIGLSAILEYAENLLLFVFSNKYTKHILCASTMHVQVHKTRAEMYMQNMNVFIVWCMWPGQFLLSVFATCLVFVPVSVSRKYASCTMFRVPQGIAWRS